MGSERDRLHLQKPDGGRVVPKEGEIVHRVAVDGRRARAVRPGVSDKQRGTGCDGHSTAGTARGSYR